MKAVRAALAGASGRLYPHPMHDVSTPPLRLSAVMSLPLDDGILR